MLYSTTVCMLRGLRKIQFVKSKTTTPLQHRNCRNVFRCINGPPKDIKNVRSIFVRPDFEIFKMKTSAVWDLTSVAASFSKLQADSCCLN